MGGLARAAGGGRLTEPLWLDGGGAALTVAPDAPTVWWFGLDDPATLARADAVAPLPDEAATFARHHDAAERGVRRRLARLLLGMAAHRSPSAVAIGRDVEGAPTVVTPAGWHLGVAARWPDAVIAIARVPLGVDLERVTVDPPVADVLTPAENQRLNDLHAIDRAAAFAACWAAKEAHAKWTRRPRTLDPATIDTGEPDIVRSRYGVTRCWRRQRQPLVAALCVGLSG